LRTRRFIYNHNGKEYLLIGKSGVKDFFEENKIGKNFNKWYKENINDNILKPYKLIKIGG
jgi:hypothetical protein